MIIISCINNILLLVLAFFLSGCQNADTKKAPSFVIVNVLDKEYFDDCHIKGSVHVPFGDLKEYALQYWDKDNTQIVIHCSNYSCGASFEGYKIVSQLGFKNVWAFEGGTAEAKEAGIPVEGPCSEPYLKEYKKPEHYVERQAVATISVEELKKKMEEFAIKP